MKARSFSSLRIGAVAYLNTKPLIWKLESANAKQHEGTALHLITDVPSRLSAMFNAGELDIALLPVLELLKAGGGQVVDDVAIACQGEVFSVFVASHEDLKNCREIYLNPSSRSSAALLRVLLAEYYPECICIEHSGTIPANAARLIIGDPAIAFRLQYSNSWQYHDLGQLWWQHTGLPFVFAVWALAPGLPNAESIAEELRNWKKAGLSARAKIAEMQPDPVFAEAYFRDYIRHDLRESEKAGLMRFAELSCKHGLLDTIPQLHFI